MSNIIVMAFSPRNIVGCLLKKRLTKGGSRAPQDPPSLRPCGGEKQEYRTGIRGGHGFESRLRRSPEFVKASFLPITLIDGLTARIVQLLP